MKQGKQEKVSERRYSGRRISHRTTIFKWIVARAIRHRIKKYAPHETNKTKANKKIREREGISDYFVTVDDTPVTHQVEDEVPYKVKNVHLKPMDVEEAIMQLDLLGHDFYVYRDMAVDAVCVVYLRKDGKYGVIETNN